MIILKKEEEKNPKDEETFTSLIFIATLVALHFTVLHFHSAHPTVSRQLLLRMYYSINAAHPTSLDILIDTIKVIIASTIVMMIIISLMKMIIIYLMMMMMAPSPPKA